MDPHRAPSSHERNVGWPRDPPGFDRAAYQPVLARDVAAFLRAALLRD